MKFLDIINKCLIELNYREVNSWDALTLNDHKRLKEIIKRLNSQICSSDEWPFLQRKVGIRLLGKEKCIENPITGTLDAITFDGVEYSFSPDYKRFLADNPVPGCFSVYGENILLPAFDKPVLCEILFNTDFSAIDQDDDEKEYLENEGDKSLIPEVFQEPLLVYGACLRLKGNTEHNKFKYWYAMFNEAIATMRSKSAPSKNQAPYIKMCR
ncbi:MAG: hypothetical protein PHN38_09695 [Sulfurospirillaceae bacterium]|nr:hypothetical protein [Sulfurospirillaceae bacterium]